MNQRIKVMTMLSACALVFGSTAHADIRDKDICPAITSFMTTINASSPNGPCFSGHPCKVGLRGAFLDLTSSASRVSGPSATVKKVDTGVDRSAGVGCVPAGNADREGWVLVAIDNIASTGTLQIKLPRFGGEDSFSVTVADGSTYVSKEHTYSTRLGETRQHSLFGRNMELLRVKDQTRGRIVISEPTVAVVEYRFPTTAEGGVTGTRSWEELVTLGTAEPAINAKYGWPSIAVTAAATTSTTTTTTTTASRNVKPTNPSPLLRPQPTFSATQPGERVDITFCSGFRPDEVREISVPAFTFNVTNTTGLAITQTFAVDVTDRAGTKLFTENVAGLAANATKVISVATWTGRQARMKLRNEQPTPCPPGSTCGVMPGRLYGCFVEPTGSVKPDPSLVIRVDPAKAITNEAFGDNSLIVQ